MRQVLEMGHEDLSPRWPDRSGGEDVVLLDVRDPAELTLGTIDSARHVPTSEMGGRLDEVDGNETIVVMRRSGGHSRCLAELLPAKSCAPEFRGRHRRLVDPGVPQR